MDNFKIRNGVLKKYDGHQKNITIPDSVTKINRKAFSFNIITELSIPGTVKSIGNSAFSDCASLAKLTISEGVTSIGNRAFECCFALPEVTIPSSVKKIGKKAFNACKSLTKVVISNGVKTIEEQAFLCCFSLTEIFIPGSVEIIGKDAFCLCRSLTKVTISDGVKNIKSGAFLGCDSLTEVSIPSSVKTIDKSAFVALSSIRKISISIEQLPLFKHLEPGVYLAAIIGCLNRYSSEKMSKEQISEFKNLLKHNSINLAEMIADDISCIKFCTENNVLTVNYAQSLMEKCTSTECRTILLNYIIKKNGTKNVSDNYKL